MKLHCKVEVHNRISPLTLKRKSQRSLLTIGRQPAKTDSYIFLQTLQNKQGVKYKIVNNVEQIFMKFINDGKATIRLIEPCHDLIIQGDATQLRSFLRVLKLVLSKKYDLSVPVVSNLNPKSICSQPNTKVVVKKMSKYSSTGFPKGTTELLVCNLKQKTFDRHILRLHCLRSLNLSNNQIVSLPVELGICLPQLRELIVSNNRLGISAKWAWLDQEPIQKNLLFLDLRYNYISELPKQIGKLSALIHLKISENRLTYLPQTIGALHNLRYLYLARNILSCLPGNIRIMRLTYLDISDNPFSRHRNDLNLECFNITISTLVEYSARCFLKTRQPYNSKLIPSTLVTYLDDVKYCCVCGNACFKSYIRRYVQFNLNDISFEIKHTASEIPVNFDCYFCSVVCSQKYLGV